MEKRTVLVGDVDDKRRLDVVFAKRERVQDLVRAVRFAPQRQLTEAG